MKVEFLTFSLSEEIPVLEYLRTRKLVKFFNRETAAAVVCLGRLLAGESLAPETPFYYVKGLVEYEDFGLDTIVAASRGPSGAFSQQAFASRGMSSISPLTQFKVLYNMPLSFIAIEHRLTGDNSVIYSSAQGLLMHARHSVSEGPLLLGAGRVYRDGSVAAGFALGLKEEFNTAPLPPDRGPDGEAIHLFRSWKQQAEEAGL